MVNKRFSLIALALVVLPYALYGQTDQGIAAANKHNVTPVDTPLHQGKESLLEPGVPEKGGKLDVAAFTPVFWGEMTTRSAWELGGASDQFALWYSYAQVKKYDGYATYVAIKVATKDKTGDYNQLAYFSGQIDCSQPGARPDTFFHAFGATYNPITGRPLHIDVRPYDLSASSKPLLMQITSHICSLFPSASEEPVIH